MFMHRARAVRCAEFGCSRGAVTPGFAAPGSGFFDALDCADPSEAVSNTMAHTLARRRIFDMLISSTRDPTHRPRLVRPVAATALSHGAADMIQNDPVVVGLGETRPIFAKFAGLFSSLRDRAGQDNFQAGAVAADPGRQDEGAIAGGGGIGENDVDGRFFVFKKNLAGLFGASRLDDNVAAFAQILGQRMTDQNIRFDDQDAFLLHCQQTTTARAESFGAVSVESDSGAEFARY